MVTKSFICSQNSQFLKLTVNSIVCTQSLLKHGSKTNFLYLMDFSCEQIGTENEPMTLHDLQILLLCLKLHLIRKKIVPVNIG